VRFLIISFIACAMFHVPAALHPCMLYSPSLDGSLHERSVMLSELISARLQDCKNFLAEQRNDPSLLTSAISINFSISLLEQLQKICASLVALPTARVDGDSLNACTLLYHEAMRVRNDPKHDEDASIFVFASVLARLLEERYQRLYSKTHKNRAPRLQAVEHRRRVCFFSVASVGQRRSFSLELDRSPPFDAELASGTSRLSSPLARVRSGGFTWPRRRRPVTTLL
jgi:hypothetical protein